MDNFVQIRATKRSLSLRKPIHGIGINDADYIVCPRVNGARLRCPFYRVWHSMLERCYSRKFQENHHTYKDCSVVKEWLAFSNFRAWMVLQDWKGKQLDKDILVIGNKTYSPDNCLFVSHAINSLLNDSEATRGMYPQGVSFDKSSGKYKAQCGVSGKQEMLGTFDSIKSAEDSYLKFKSKLITDVAISTSDNILKHALMRHAVAFSDRIGE